MKINKSITFKYFFGIYIFVSCSILFACSTKNIPQSHCYNYVNADEQNFKYHSFVENKNNNTRDKDVIETLSSLLMKKNYPELTATAAQFIITDGLSQYHSYVYQVLSKANFETEEVENGLLFFLLALKYCNQQERENLFYNFESDLCGLDPELVSLALSHINSIVSKGELLYKLAQIKYENRKYTDAKRLLVELIESAPKHEKTLSAQKMLTQIDSITRVDLRRIGCLLPLSGPYEVFGNKALKGIMYAVTEFNSQNPNSPFEITVIDTESNFRTVDRMVAELDEKRVALIIGPLAHSKEAAVEAQKRGIPIITLTQKEGICDIGDFVFRHFITARMQVEALLSSATVNFGIRRFAVLYPDEPYGRTFAELFIDAAKRHEVAIKKVVAYKPDQTDFGDQIRSMVRYEDKVSDRNVRSRNSNRHQQREVLIDFEALFIPDSSPKISMVAPQLEYHDVNGILLFGTNLWHSNELIVSAGNYVQEAVVPDIYFGNSSAETVKRFVSGFQSQFDDPPGFMEAITYDTANMVFQTLLAPGLASRNDIRVALQNMASFDGVTGRTIFDNIGESRKELHLLQIVGDRFVELKHAGPIYSYLREEPKVIEHE